MTIEVKNLKKFYGEQAAVNDISFSAAKGELVGFLGPNGAGKSTTMKILTCYIAATSGMAKICGKEIYDNSLEVRRFIGYLPENNPLYKEMYIREYLMFIAGMYGVRKPSSRVSEMIKVTGLEPEKNKKIGALSKGYRQRVGLAQALIHDPEVLILDEPTTGLDPNQIIEIRDLIMQVGREKTVLLSSHILQEVQAMCDRVIIIDQGKIVADDKTETLLSRGKGRQLLIARFRDPVNVTELKQLKGVSNVEMKEGKVFISGSGKKLNEDVFFFAVEKGNPILEMQSESGNLETVFQQLTGRK